MVVSVSPSVAATLKAADYKGNYNVDYSLGSSSNPNTNVSSNNATYGYQQGTGLGNEKGSGSSGQAAKDAAEAQIKAQLAAQKAIADKAYQAALSKAKNLTESQGITQSYFQNLAQINASATAKKLEQGIINKSTQPYGSDIAYQSVSKSDVSALKEFANPTQPTPETKIDIFKEARDLGLNMNEINKLSLGKQELFGGKPYAQLNAIQRRGTTTITNIAGYSDKELLDMPSNEALYIYSVRQRESLNNAAKKLQLELNAGKITEKQANKILEDKTNQANDKLSSAARQKNIQAAVLRAPLVAGAGLLAAALLPASVLTAATIYGGGQTAYSLYGSAKNPQVSSADFKNQLAITGIDTAAALFGGYLGSRIGKVTPTDLVNARIEKIGGNIKTKFLAEIRQSFEPDIRVAIGKGKISSLNVIRVTLSDGRMYDIASFGKLKTGDISGALKGETAIFGRQVLPSGSKLKPEFLVGKQATSIIGENGETYSKIYRAKMNDTNIGRILERFGIRKGAGEQIELVEKSRLSGGRLGSRLNAGAIESETRTLSSSGMARNLFLRINSIAKKLNKNENISTSEIKNLINLERRMNDLKPFSEGEWKASGMPTLTRIQILEALDKARISLSKSKFGDTFVERMSISQKGKFIGKGIMKRIPKPFEKISPRVREAQAKREGTTIKEMKQNIFERKLIQEHEGIANRYEQKLKQRLERAASKSQFGQASLVKAVLKPLGNQKRTTFFGLKPSTTGLKSTSLSSTKLKTESNQKSSLVLKTIDRTKQENKQISSSGLKSYSETTTKLKTATTQLQKLRQETQQKLRYRMQTAQTPRLTSTTFIPLKPIISIPKLRMSSGKARIKPFANLGKGRRTRESIKARFERQATLRRERPSKSPLNQITGREFNPVRTGLLKSYLGKKFERQYQRAGALKKYGKIKSFKVVR